MSYCCRFMALLAATLAGTSVAAPNRLGPSSPPLDTSTPQRVPATAPTPCCDAPAVAP